MISEVEFSGKVEDYAFQGGLQCTEAITTHQIAAGASIRHSYPLTALEDGDWYVAVEIDLDGQDRVASEVQLILRDY